MYTKNNHKEKNPKKLTEIGSGAHVSEMIKSFLCYYELVKKNYKEEEFLGLSENSEKSLKNVKKMAKKTGIHPNLTRELILLHEKAEKIIDVRENIDLCHHEQTMQIGEILDMCPSCVEKINL